MSDETDKLPALKPGAVWAVDLVPALVSEVLALVHVPGSNIAAAFLKSRLETQLHKGTEVLIEEFQKANIGILTKEQAQIFIPNAYRFFEAAKQGEYTHNLRLLARIMAGNAASNGGTTADVMRFARKIEGLTDEELQLLWHCHLLSEDIKRQPEFDGQSRLLNGEELCRMHPSSYGSLGPEGVMTLRGRLAEFSGRGFLVSDPLSTWGANKERYFTTDALRDLVNLAKLEFPSPNDTPTT